MAKSHRDHLQSSHDLETTYEAIRAGFVALALEKNRRATPYVAEARALKSAASKAKVPIDLFKIEGIRSGLLTAAGVSDKAAGYLEESDKDEAIAGLIGKYLEPAGVNFVEELVFRFLLTRGDALGGSMRNVGGFMAQCRLRAYPTTAFDDRLVVVARAAHQIRRSKDGPEQWRGTTMAVA